MLAAQRGVRLPPRRAVCTRRRQRRQRRHLALRRLSLGRTQLCRGLLELRLHLCARGALLPQQLSQPRAAALGRLGALLQRRLRSCCYLRRLLVLPPRLSKLEGVGLSRLRLLPRG